MQPPLDLTPTDFDREYPSHLGRLIANLSTLEFNLRVVLYLMDTPHDKRRKRGWLIKDMSVGEEIETSWLNYSWAFRRKWRRPTMRDGGP
jgi:hypothetical protein